MTSSSGSRPSNDLGQPRRFRARYRYGKYLELLDLS